MCGQSRTFASLCFLVVLGTVAGCHREQAHDVVGGWKGNVGRSPVEYQFVKDHTCKLIVTVMGNETVTELGTYTFENDRLSLKMTKAEAANPTLEDFYGKHLGEPSTFKVSWPDDKVMRLDATDAGSKRMVTDHVNLTRA